MSLSRFFTSGNNVKIRLASAPCFLHGSFVRPAYLKPHSFSSPEDVTVGSKAAIETGFQAF